MAREIYGHGSFDYVAQISSDGDYEPSAGTFDVFTTRTGATQHTSLLNMAGGAITAVTPDANGWIRFQGVDNYKGSYWLQNQATPSNPRWRCDPVGMAERLIAVETGGGVGVTDGNKGEITVSSSGTVWTGNANAVTTAKILDANVTSAKLASNAVTTAKITDANVTTAKILDANVTTAKVADGAITPIKLDASTAIEVLYTGTAWPTYSTDPNKVRRFRSEPYASTSAAPTAYNIYDTWWRV